MLPESIENILGFSRKRVIEIYDYIVMIGGLMILISIVNVTQESVSCLDFKIWGRNNASVCCHSTILMLAFPLMQHLICMPDLAHIPELISRQYFSWNISI